MKRTLIVVLAAIATALGIIAISQAAPTLRHHSSPPGDRFSILGSVKRAAPSAGGLPAATAKHLTESGTLVSEYELEPASAAYVELSPATHAWVIPGRSGMCLAVPVFDGLSIASTCGSLASAEEGGLIMIRRPSSGPVIFGLAPDDASVTATNTDGSRTSVPVTHNVFMYTDPNIRAVTVHPSGARELTTTVKQP